MAMQIAPYFRQYELPWSPSDENESRFRKLLRNLLIALLVIGIMRSETGEGSEGLFGPAEHGQVAGLARRWVQRLTAQDRAARAAAVGARAWRAWLPLASAESRSGSAGAEIEQPEQRDAEPIIHAR